MNPRTFLRHLAPLSLALLLGACATQQSTTSTSAPVEAPATTLAPMPEAVTSFAAVTSDGWLYVFGGHKGERHDYSADFVSGAFHRLRLADGAQWETLPSASAAQGVPLVAYKGSVYRTGGMAARNHQGEKQDLFSRAEVLRFDPRHGQWENLPALPDPRSSHDAVVLGDKLYVAGGWSLRGGTNKAVWPDHALVLELKHTEQGWQKFPQPFQRRALALAALGTQIYCIGGMYSDNTPTDAVEIYDTETGKWSSGPALPTGKFKGFSCSAITQAGRVYVNAFKGDLLRLSLDGKSWELVGQVQHPRMAHRLVTAGSKQLIALGGEDGESKRPDLELLTPAVTALAAQSPATPTANR